MRGTGTRAVWLLWLPVLALVLTLPLWLRGPSCGHDFGFHFQSWMDVAAQWRAGVALPRWAVSPAYFAGEPRFVFYPPLSWLLGAALLRVLPAELVPAAFTFVALTLAGLGMFALARLFAGPAQALLAAALYLVNPYMLFTAWERSAYGELLATAILPWLFREALRAQPRVLGLACPIALLWLANAPAAVMGVYALVSVVLVRCALAWRRQPVWPLLRAWGGGLLLGLGLPAFFLLPAAWERRYVQIAMAILPDLRVEDNFLFGQAGDAAHRAVLHRASLVAVVLLGLCAGALAFASLRRARETARESRLTLLMVAVTVGLLLWPVSLPLWRLLPEMRFLQFPWRLLAVLACVWGAAAAMALQRLRLRAGVAVVITLLLAGGGAWVGTRIFREGCEAHELPRDRLALFLTGHGAEPTDEYTPGRSDNDRLHLHDPAWWVADTVDAPGPGSVVNPAAVTGDYDTPPPLQETVSAPAPSRLTLTVQHPEVLVLHLRDYPAWEVLVNGAVAPHLQRADGLLAVPVPAGTSVAEVHWRTLPDVWAGEALSCLSLGVAGVLALRRRRRESTGALR